MPILSAFPAFCPLLELFSQDFVLHIFRWCTHIYSCYFCFYSPLFLFFENFVLKMHSRIPAHYSTLYTICQSFSSSTTHLSKANSKNVLINSFRLCPVLADISSICVTISSLILIEKTLYPSSPFAFFGFITKFSFFIPHLHSIIFYA